MRKRFRKLAHDPKRNADGIIRTIWVDDDSIWYPIDPVRICRRIGIDVFEADFDDSVSGCVLKDPYQDPRVFVNRNDAQPEQRLAVTTALGCYVEHSYAHKSAQKFEQVLLRGDSCADSFANDFAMHLLLPDLLLWPLLRSGALVCVLKNEFGVPARLAARRIANA